MPYRRLPNTDTARIRAMKTALELGKELPPHKLAYSSNIINSIITNRGRHLPPRKKRVKIIMRWPESQGCILPTLLR